VGLDHGHDQPRLPAIAHALEQRRAATVAILDLGIRLQGPGRHEVICLESAGRRVRQGECEARVADPLTTDPTRISTPPAAIDSS
jgi:hypothetical protein